MNLCRTDINIVKKCELRPLRLHIQRSVSPHSTIGIETSCWHILLADPDALGLHCYDDSWAELRARLRASLRATCQATQRCTPDERLLLHNYAIGPADGQRWMNTSGDRGPAHLVPAAGGNDQTAVPRLLGIE